MTQRLTNKTILITAAGAGIGRASAIQCQREGATVWATDIDDAALSELAREHPQINCHSLDVTDASAISQLSETIGDIDALFNCAGFVHNGTILECDEKDWDFSFEINVKSCYTIIRSFLPGMIRRGGGSIINISSVASSVKGVPNRFAYGATKAAIIGLSKAVAADYVAQGIRCNAICPGTVDTPSLQQRLNQFDDPQAARNEFEQRQPMGRLGSAEEIAALVVYLASDESSYTTGAIHLIDGGWSN
ncbi:2-keto-3-deoxy-L-fuconate dehydrogenase [Halioglobus japonicus]|nr:2-keto-3-deoxy-L-fuconate dehydrogenase [Halioglobus japonicus]